MTIHRRMFEKGVGGSLSLSLRSSWIKKRTVVEPVKTIWCFSSSDRPFAGMVSTELYCFGHNPVLFQREILERSVLLGDDFY